MRLRLTDHLRNGYVYVVTEANVRAILAEHVHLAGGSDNFARLRGLSRTYVAMALRRDRTLGPKILAALKIRKTTTYEWIEE